MMQEELAEFEQRLNNLRKDLAANPNDERVINAMLEYYQAKLSVINMIVNKLEEVKQQQKNTQHEIEI
jgi:chromosome segregation ATPase